MICSACGLSGIPTVAVLREHGCGAQEDWARVAELKREGHGDSANRLARRLLGVKGEPMDEGTKERLRQWKEEHAQEIKDRKELDRQTQERLAAIKAPTRGPLRRKA